MTLCCEHHSPGPDWVVSLAGSGRALWIKGPRQLCKVWKPESSRQEGEGGRNKNRWRRASLGLSGKKVSEGCSVVSNSLGPHGLYSPWNSPGQNTGVGSRSLLQGIFSTQGSNPGLPHGRWILLSYEPPGKPRNTAVGSLSLLQGIFLTQ